MYCDVYIIFLFLIIVYFCTIFILNKNMQFKPQFSAVVERQRSLVWTATPHKWERGRLLEKHIWCHCTPSQRCVKKVSTCHVWYNITCFNRLHSLTFVLIRVIGLESWTWTPVGLESGFLKTWTWTMRTWLQLWFSLQLFHFTNQDYYCQSITVYYLANYE